MFTGNLFADLSQMSKHDVLVESMIQNCVKYLFEHYDKDNSKNISAPELFLILKDINTMFRPADRLSEEKLQSHCVEIMSRLDKDQNGTIELVEFDYQYLMNLFKQAIDSNKK